MQWKQLGFAILLSTGVGLGSAPALADDNYPNRPIRMLVGFGAGGPTDVTFRFLAEKAGDYLGQPIVVENRPGAGATLAPSSMAKSAKPDGYTIAAATAGLLRFPHMHEVDWNPLQDFTWIIGLGGYTFVLAVRDDSPFKTVDDLVEYSRQQPGHLSVGTAGAGTTMHLLAEAMAGQADAEIIHVGFKSSSENATNLLGGHTDATVDAIGSLLPHVEAGNVRVLMTFDAEPAEWLDGVPTARSLGYELVYPAPYGLVGPKGMPTPIVEKLHDAFQFAIESEGYAKLLEQLRQTAWYKPTDQYGQWAAEFYESERSLVELAGLLRQP